MLLEVKTEMISLAEISPLNFLTSGFVLRQIPSYDLCIHTYVSHTRNDHIVEDDKGELSNPHTREPARTQEQDLSEPTRAPRALQPLLAPSPPPPQSP